MARLQADRKLLFIHGKQRQVHAVEVAILYDLGRKILAVNLHSRSSPESETCNVSRGNYNTPPQVNTVTGPCCLLRSSVNVDGIGDERIISILRMRRLSQ